VRSAQVIDLKHTWRIEVEKETRREIENAMYLDRTVPKLENKLSTISFTPKNTMQNMYISTIRVTKRTTRRYAETRKESTVSKVMKARQHIYAPLVCLLENLVLLFALIKLLLPPLASVSPLPLTSPLLPAVRVLPFLVATRPSSLLFSTTS
jgi:hypothetical protein